MNTHIYEETYQDYIAQLKTMDLTDLPERLGVEIEGNDIQIPFYGMPYAVSNEGIVDPHGRQPPLDVSVILFKYILLCPAFPPKGNDWTAYRDMKDTGPLTVFFDHDVERIISDHFVGRPRALADASRQLGAYPPELDARYDVVAQFDGLPKVPVLMLFNDGDEEFPARCSILFERRAEQYLDPESLAMLGSFLAHRLKKADRQVSV